MVTITEFCFFILVVEVWDWALKSKATLMIPFSILVAGGPYSDFK